MAESVQHSHHATKLIDHIRELKKRVLISFVSLVVAGIVVYIFYEPLLDLLRSPLGAPLFYSSPAGSFAFIMKVCFMGALAVTIPIIIFNIIMFIRPAFSKHAPVGRVVTTSIFSAVLAFAGAAFGYLFIIPGALHFFAGFQVSGLNALISADSYLGFVTNVIITFIIVFQLPLIVSFIDRIKPISPKKLLAGEKWVILGSLVVSVLVPFAFDLVTSLLIALPIVVLYNLSVIMVAVRHAQNRHKQKALRSRFNIGDMPSSTLSLETLSYDDLVGQQPKSVLEQPVAPTQTKKPLVRQQYITMDIRTVKKPQVNVTPPEWVNRVHASIPIDPRSRLVSF